MLVLVLLVAILFAFGMATWRLFLHPLRMFPGPPLAALSTWYQGYYDVIKQGALLCQVQALHDMYGSVVRIGPNELSFNDPKAYSDIYAVGSKFVKEPSFYNCFGVPLSSFGTVDPRFSRTRRELLNPLFSRRAILKLESVVQEKVDRLVSRLMSNGVSQKPVNLSMAFRCATLEIITAYCLDQSLQAIDAPGFQHPFLSSLRSAIPFFWVLKYLPFLSKIFMDPPEWVFTHLLAGSRGIFDFRRQIATHLDKLLENLDVLHSSNQDIIYHYLLAPSTNAKERNPLSKTDLFQEALALLLAGSDTVGNTCTVGFFHVLHNPPVLQKTFAELQEVWPDKDTPIALETLEKLPYLTAVIKESLRHAHGVVSALPRIVGPKDAVIDGVHVPAGTIVSMSSVSVHMNKGVFEDPSLFRPERWLEQKSHSLESWLVAFSRGPRMCPGINLAWCELYRLFSNLFRKLDLELYNTTAADFTSFGSFFVPIHHGNELHVTVQAKPI